MDSPRMYSGTTKVHHNPDIQNVLERWKTHLDDFVWYLGEFLDIAYPDYKPVKRTRRDLTRIATIHFEELLTDVLDEVDRRRAEDGASDRVRPAACYHPRRLRSRKQMTEMSATAFYDFCSDVHFELLRRYGLVLQS